MLDVIVIGAGPAGCVAARDIARAGARVAIVDGSHPREKPCGGGVTGRALEFAGASAANVRGYTVRRVVFEAGRRAVTIGIDAVQTLRIFNREAFDAALLHEATAAGAVHRPARASQLKRTGDGWEVATAYERLRASWLIGADGVCGITRRVVAQPFERSDLSIATGSFVDGTTADEVVVGFTDDPRGYLWSFPRPDRLAVGACSQADTTTPAALHAVTDRWLEGYAPAAGWARRRYSWPIPSPAAERIGRQPTSGDRWLLLGDAAGLVDPITREGIYFALASGAAAAAALAGVDPERAYDRRIRDQVHPELRRAARLKDAFFRPRFTRLLIDALESSAAIRGVMVDLIAGRQPYDTLKRRLLGTLEFGLMARIVCRRGAS
ncbi:MAG TPA: geranylgeranyl reductase family protein [Vicinamibacterales bacterium]|nr:geranylgeranyl reductase family protein [Vicinamibacterales bacterium]